MSGPEDRTYFFKWFYPLLVMACEMHDRPAIIKYAEHALSGDFTYDQVLSVRELVKLYLPDPKPGMEMATVHWLDWLAMTER
jgi:hypothetical protein